jgi:hypothetical protein
MRRTEAVDRSLQLQSAERLVAAVQSIWLGARLVTDAAIYAEVQTAVEASSWTNVKMSVDCKPVANLQESIITEFSAGVVAQGSEGQVYFTGPTGLPVGAELFPTGTAGYWVIIEGLTPGKHTIITQATFINKYFNCPNPTTGPCTSARTESINVIAHP